MRAKVSLLLGLVFFLGCVSTKSSNVSDNYNVSVSIDTKSQPYGNGDFCGVSTYGSCDSDAECQEGGCSSQICQSAREEGVFTTCEYRECYNAKKYGLKCKCFGKRCQWVQ